MNKITRIWIKVFFISCYVNLLCTNLRLDLEIFEEAFELVHEADPVAVGDHAVLADHQGVVGGHVVGHEAVVGARHLERQGGLLVLIVIQENVLSHPEAFSDAKMVEQRTLLSLE